MKDLLHVINQHLGNDPFSYECWEEIAQHGAAAGWRGFTYYKDTEEFYDNNENEILELAGQAAEDCGHDTICEFVSTFATPVETASQYKNALAWFALEEVARWVEDMGEEDYNEIYIHE